MIVDMTRELVDFDGSPALERKAVKDQLGVAELKHILVALTAGSAVMQALNAGDCSLAEKGDRYAIITKIRKCPQAVELVESEPETVRAAVAKAWPPMIYGQVCELLNLK